MKTKTQVGYEFSQKMGIMYKVITEKDLSQGSYVESIKVILRFFDLPQTFNCYLSEILEIVRKSGEMRISSMGMFFQKIEKRIITACTFHLLNTHELLVDLEKPLNQNSIVSTFDEKN